MSSRKQLLEEFKENGFDVDKAIQEYLAWVFDDKYLILSRFESKTILIRDSRNNQILRIDLPDPDAEAQVFAIKCSKRG